MHSFIMRTSLHTSLLRTSVHTSLLTPPMHTSVHTSKAPRIWWGFGLTKIQPVAKLRFKTTGKESMTCFIYVNSHFIPGLGPR